MTEPLSRDEFRTAANHAIHAVLNLYREMRDLFRHLKDCMAADPAFQTLGGTVRPPGGNRPGRQDDDILQHWQGRLFVPDQGDDEGEEEDEGDDGEEDGGGKQAAGWVDVPVGGSLLFARVQTYRRGDMGFEPHLLYGVLTDARVASAKLATDTLTFRKWQLRLILSDLDHERWSPKKNTLRTKVRIKATKGVKLDQRRVSFTIPAQPRLMPLYEIDSPAVVEKIAGELKQMWPGAPE